MTKLLLAWIWLELSELVTSLSSCVADTALVGLHRVVPEFVPHKNSNQVRMLTGWASAGLYRFIARPGRTSHQMHPYDSVWSTVSVA